MWRSRTRTVRAPWPTSSPPAQQGASLQMANGRSRGWHWTRTSARGRSLAPPHQLAPVADQGRARLHRPASPHPRPAPGGRANRWAGEGPARPRARSCPAPPEGAGAGTAPPVGPGTGISDRPSVPAASPEAPYRRGVHAPLRPRGSTPFQHGFGVELGCRSDENRMYFIL